MIVGFSIDRKRPISGIYCIHNLRNNKRYIGSSVNVVVRLEKHRSLLRNNKHENAYLQNAWNKYTEESFICYLLEAYDLNIESMLIEREQFWVDFLNSEYNLTKLVERNVLSKESRLKQSETRKRLFREKKLIPSSYKAIKKYDLDGNFISRYNSVNEAAASESVHVTTVISSAQKKTSQGSGFIWRYESDNSEVIAVFNCKRTKWKDLVKSDKLLENPEEDNQQPIQELNALGGFND